jgi:hypothetical protein
VDYKGRICHFGGRELLGLYKRNEAEMDITLASAFWRYSILHNQVDTPAFKIVGARGKD